MFAENHERSAGATVCIRIRRREVVKDSGNQPLEVHWLQWRLPGNLLQQADPLLLGVQLLLFEALAQLANRR